MGADDGRGHETENRLGNAGLYGQEPTTGKAAVQALANAAAFAGRRHWTNGMAAA